MDNKHITIGIYPNMDYIYNIVKEEDLENHIQYNLDFRPGRIFYVDGKRINNGCIKEECLSQYDELADKIYKKIYKNINYEPIKRPYL